MPNGRWLAGVLVGVSLALTACASSEEELGEASSQAAEVQAVKGSDLRRVTLTAEASARLGIRTEPVRGVSSTAGTGGLTVIPLAALLYDPEGKTWIYTSPTPRTFVRTRVTIDHASGTLAYLREGPPAGTPVVTVGASELFGAEYGVGGE